MSLTLVLPELILQTKCALTFSGVQKNIIMNNNPEEIIKKINNAIEYRKATPDLKNLYSEFYQVMFNWIRTTITILVPSLALLIGLQEKNLSGEKIQNALLLISILVMTLSILIGLWILLYEAELHANVADELKYHVAAGKKTEDYSPVSNKYSSIQAKLLKSFPWLVGISILFLGSFGFVKYWQF